MAWLALGALYAATGNLAATSAVRSGPDGPPQTGAPDTSPKSFCSMTSAVLPGIDYTRLFARAVEIDHVKLLRYRRKKHHDRS